MRIQGLEQLVRHYPQPKYWDDLLADQLYTTKGDRELRTLYRLMDQTNTLDKAEEYSEMAAALITGGFPAEAEQILQPGMSANLFSGDAKTRAQSDLDRARSGAAADRKDLPGAGQALASAKTGNEMVATGKLYFSAASTPRRRMQSREGLPRAA